MTSLGRGVARRTLIGRLVDGDVDGAIELFGTHPEIHDPQQGRIRGTDAIARHLQQRSAWFQRAHAEAEPLDLTFGESLELEEVDVILDGPRGRATVPIATVIERDDAGLIREARVYFPAWYVRGDKSRRPPVLPADDSITGSDVVEEYHRLLAEGDGPGMAGLFVEDSYVREPLGTIATGLAEVRRWHAQFAEGSGAGMPLNWCSSVDDGSVSAFEYMAESWGDSVFAPIGGIVVFHQSDDNRLIAARVYEEASPED